MKIVLIGFMGAGKSTVGKLLAERLGLEFIEMDTLVVKRSGKEDISDIFKDDGEEVFRSLEKEVAASLLNLHDVVIASGGGVVERRENLPNLKKDGVVVYLEASFETLHARLRGCSDRPLFKDINSARLLYERRMLVYRSWADHVIITDTLVATEVAEKIIAVLGKYD